MKKYLDMPSLSICPRAAVRLALTGLVAVCLRAGGDDSPVTPVTGAPGAALGKIVETPGPMLSASSTNSSGPGTASNALSEPSTIVALADTNPAALRTTSLPASNLTK